MVQKGLSTRTLIGLPRQHLRYSCAIFYLCFGTILSIIYWSFRKKHHRNQHINFETLRSNWVDHLKNYSKSIYSQGGQDGIIEEIFNHMEPKNKTFVEFGFGYAAGEQNILRKLHGTNTFYLTKKGWTGWRFDALIELKSIGLHRELLSPNNIVQTFRKYNIPKDVDYVSIDVDSIDLWLFHGLIKDREYAPQVISIEYNANFPYTSTATCDSSWDPWALDVVYGTSIGAILHVASRAGYFPVYVDGVLDVFLVSQEALVRSGGTALSVAEMEIRFPLPRRVHGLRNSSKLNRFVDYRTFEKTGDMNVARKASEKDRDLLRKLHGDY